MNLPYRCRLLAAADAQRHGFIKLRGIQADQEVRLMVQAGLVEATFDQDEEGSFTSINGLTEAGRTFLQTYNDPSIPAPSLVLPRTQSPVERQSDSQGGVLEKWRAKFELEQRAPEQAT